MLHVCIPIPSAIECANNFTVEPLTLRNPIESIRCRSICPFNRGCPLYRESVKRGSTVATIFCNNCNYFIGVLIEL